MKICQMSEQISMRKFTFLTTKIKHIFLMSFGTSKIVYALSDIEWVATLGDSIQFYLIKLDMVGILLI